MLKILQFICMVIQLSYAQIDDKHELLPDVIDKMPDSILIVTYKNNVQVQGGNELTPTMVVDPPTVKWEANPKDFYLLIMTDPDATSRANPILREWLHWIVGNIPGSDVSKGEVLAEYIGAGPPPKKGLHRYVQLLYKQPDEIDYSKFVKLNNTSAAGRAKFSTRCFAKEYNLGEPIAVNLFQAQYDSSVPLLYEKMNENIKNFTT